MGSPGEFRGHLTSRCPGVPVTYSRRHLHRSRARPGGVRRWWDSWSGAGWYHWMGHCIDSSLPAEARAFGRRSGSPDCRRRELLWWPGSLNCTTDYWACRFCKREAPCGIYRLTCDTQKFSNRWSHQFFLRLQLSPRMEFDTLKINNSKQEFCPLFQLDIPL